MNKIITVGEKLHGEDYKDREGAYLIAFEGEQFVAVKTSKGYFLHGGGIKHGESDEACIERECLEELGFEVRVNDFVLCGEEYTKHEKIGYFHPIQRYYTGTLLKKIKDSIEPENEPVLLDIKDIKSKMYVKIQGLAVEYANKKRIL